MNSSQKPTIAEQKPVHVKTKIHCRNDKHNTWKLYLSFILVTIICIQIFTACDLLDDLAHPSGNTENENSQSITESVNPEANDTKDEEITTESESTTLSDVTSTTETEKNDDPDTTDDITDGKETENPTDIVDNQVYTITYLDAPTNTNPTTYTSKDNIILSNAFWPGLSFSHWSDKNGNIIEEIPSGTTGNITLFANWKCTENLAVSNNSSEIYLSLFNDQLNAYQFVYDLGSIHNVVLDELSAYKYNGATNHTWSISETVSFTESNAKVIASTISKSVTNSSSWSSAVSSAKNSSNSIDASVSSEISAKWAGTGASISASLGAGSETGSSSTTSNTSGGSSGSTSGQSESVSSTLTFVSDTSTQVTRSETLSPALSPAGLYRYVQAGDIRVFAVVTYDIDTKNYHINIMSFVIQTYETMLYSPVADYNNDVNIMESDPFEFDIDVQKIANDIIANSYFVEFNANGGSGSMPKQMILPNSTVSLYKNQFKKAGHAFAGWRIVNGDKSVVYLDRQSVQNLGSPKETVRLEAIWTSTEPVWEEVDGGSFYYADIPSTVDMNHSVLKNMKTQSYTEYETETTKRVVTIQWAGYVYWHWMYDTSASGTATRAIYHKKGTGPDNGYGYKYFFAFTSTKGDYKSDVYYCNSQNIRNYIVNDQKTSNAECGGSTRWFRFDYYICTYTDYVISE